MQDGSGLLSISKQRFVSDLLRAAWAAEELWRTPELSLEALIDPSIANARRLWLLEQWAGQFVRARKLRAPPKREAETPATNARREPLEEPVLLTPMMQAFALDLFDTEALRDLSRAGGLRTLLNAADPDGRRKWLIKQCVHELARARKRRILPLRCATDAARRPDWPPTGVEMLEASGYEIHDHRIVSQPKPHELVPSRFTTEHVEWIHLPYEEDPDVLRHALYKKDRKPASIEYLLAYGALTPKRSRKKRILLLSSWGREGLDPAYLYGEGPGVLRALPCRGQRLSCDYQGSRDAGYWTPTIPL